VSTAGFAREVEDYPRVNGESEGGIRIGDCYVWAEIYYLDSPTNYRDYLPQDRVLGPRTVPLDDWVILEPSERSPRIGSKPLLGWIVFLSILLISGLVSYCAFEVL
jgi:hypothetical protein